MRVLDTPICQVTERDILNLKQSQVQESINLDYKRDLPTTKDDGREFLADVCAFANTLGGTMVFGIEEEKDEQGKNTGLPSQIVGVGGVNLDQEIQRIENMLEGLDPRLTNVVTHAVQVEGKTVLLLGVPHSLFAPHMSKKDGRFYSRRNSGKLAMEAREIRQAFLASDSWERQLDNFRRSRVMDVLTLDLLPDLQRESGCTFLHILPLGPRDTVVNLAKHQGRLLNSISLPDGGKAAKWNLDGYMIYQGIANSRSYALFLRNGGLEFASMYFYRVLRKEHGERRFFIGQALETLSIEYATNYFQLSTELSVEPPFVVFLSVLGLKDAFMYFEGSQYFWDDRGRFDRDQVLLPGLVVETLDDIDVPRLMKPLFDTLWQAAGIERK